VLQAAGVLYPSPHFQLFATEAAMMDALRARGAP